MILSGNAIRDAVERGDILIEPYNPAQLQTNSYDLRLSPYIMEYKAAILDIAKEMETREYEIGPGGLVLHPGRLYLGSTVERTHTKKYFPEIQGRSSVGRYGIEVHATAGSGEVGFDGTWTLEISVEQPVRIYAGVRIGQIKFFESAPVEPEFMYKGKYMGQTKPRASRLFLERNEWLL